MMSKIEDVVCRKIQERAAQGVIKYGVSMERGDLSRLDWLRHLQQELIDGLAYIEKLIQAEEALLVDVIPWAKFPRAKWAITTESGDVHLNTNDTPPAIRDGGGWAHHYAGWIAAGEGKIAGSWRDSLRARPDGV